MLDILLLIILAVVTWCVAGEGVWGAALVVFSVLFGGLIAMNFYEPVAAMLSGGGSWDYWWDFIALIGLFAVSVTGLRMATEYLMPLYVEVLPLMYDIGRWGLGVAAGYLTMAFLATAVQTAPLPREILGYKPEDKMLFGLGPDRQWLGLTQYVTEHVYHRGRIFDGERGPAIPEKWMAGRSDLEKEELMLVWSSFPARYAFRREEYVRTAGGGTAAAPTNAAPQAAPSTGGAAPAF
jgi:hypothetical protein